MTSIMIRFAQTTNNGVITNMKNLLELQTRIYNQNLEMGWHDNPRSFNTFVCLFHSELSEAMEGLRKNLMDDHLPEYPMVAVELADFVIRVLDWFGSVDDATVMDTTPHEFPQWDNIDYIAELHQMVSAAMFFKDIEGGFDDIEQNLNNSISVSESMAIANGWNLLEIINKKLEYNKYRNDHKRENREKENGKKF